GRGRRARGSVRRSGVRARGGARAGAGRGRRQDAVDPDKRVQHGARRGRERLGACAGGWGRRRACASTPVAPFVVVLGGVRARAGPFRVCRRGRLVRVERKVDDGDRGKLMRKGAGPGRGYGYGRGMLLRDHREMVVDVLSPLLNRQRSVVEGEGGQGQRIDRVYGLAVLVGGAGRDGVETPLGCALGEGVVILHKWCVGNGDDASVVAGEDIREVSIRRYLHTVEGKLYVVRVWCGKRRRR
ncbi:hypothetical protein B0H10DRAFT_2106658, partial [Mycena sp. CBHHK59/15]